MATGKGKGKRKGNAGNGPVVAVAVGVIALIALMGFGIMQSNRQGRQQLANKELLKPNQYGCTSSPVRLEMPGLERVLCKSAGHVAGSVQVKYETDPPLSGEHHDVTVTPGFYAEVQVPERLVHSLEHGNVVIYYDQGKVTTADIAALRSLAGKYPGAWDGVVVVPRGDSANGVILTAWEHALRLPQYDKAKIDQFVDAFRGRGPENPVRPLPVK